MSDSASGRNPPSLPGYFFDEETQRYFPLSEQRRILATRKNKDTLSSDALKSPERSRQFFRPSRFDQILDRCVFTEFKWSHSVALGFPDRTKIYLTRNYPNGLLENLTITNDNFDHPVDTIELGTDFSNVEWMRIVSNHLYIYRKEFHDNFQSTHCYCTIDLDDGTFRQSCFEEKSAYVGSNPFVFTKDSVTTYNEVCCNKIEDMDTKNLLALEYVLGIGMIASLTGGKIYIIPNFKHPKPVQYRVPTEFTPKWIFPLKAIPRRLLFVSFHGNFVQFDASTGQSELCFHISNLPFQSPQVFEKFKIFEASNTEDSFLVTYFQGGKEVLIFDGAELSRSSRRFSFKSPIRQVFADSTVPFKFYIQTINEP